MEKKTGNNMSSGAQKVERTARESEAARENEAQMSAAQQAREQARAAEQAAAQARFEAAKLRAAKKESARIKAAKHKEREIGERLTRQEKKLQARAEKMSERAQKKAARAARRELRAAETKAERKARIAREKRERLAKKEREARERTERRGQKRAKKRTSRTEGRGRAPGIGGWIAAVSVLGAACLALAAVVTVGSVRMSEMTLRSANGFRATLYELVSVTEELDDSLAKLRVSSGAGEQRALLTEVLVGTAVMESAVERLPVDAATGMDISSYVNRTGMCARGLLRRLSAGGTLGERERALIASLCERNAQLSAALNDLALHTPAEELAAFFEGKESGVGARFAELGQGAAGKQIADAPFSDGGNVGENAVIGIAEVSSSEAEERVRAAFEGYHLADVRMTGETASRFFKAYNFTLIDENGVEYAVMVTKNGGRIAFFDGYEACTQKNFSLDACDAVAREFLEGLGYTRLTPVWYSDGGTVASITYVADVGGVRVYPDMIRVRVCEERGRVVGMDAQGYLVNHHGKRETKPTLTEGEARARLSSELEVESAHLALIPLGGREVLTHEFLCSSGQERFILYLDAHTGEEVAIFRVHESAQGSYLS